MKVPMLKYDKWSSVWFLWNYYWEINILFKQNFTTSLYPGYFSINVYLIHLFQVYLFYSIWPIFQLPLPKSLSKASIHLIFYVIYNIVLKSIDIAIKMKVSTEIKTDWYINAKGLTKVLRRFHAKYDLKNFILPGNLWNSLEIIGTFFLVESVHYWRYLSPIAPKKMLASFQQVRWII